MTLDHGIQYGWWLELGTVDYERALAWQRNLVKMRQGGLARDTIILLEHPPVVTVGKDGHEENYKSLAEQAVFVERGGDVTFHGPGQLVAYFIFNVARRGRDVKKFMSNIQQGIIDTMAEYDITARKDDEYTGVWVKDRKIASVGVAIKKWISFHGAAINLTTDLSSFDTINPCGLNSKIMTSLSALTGTEIDRYAFGLKLVEKYVAVFETDFRPITLDELDEDIKSQSGGDHV